jgi:hypothetical protein
MCWNWSAPSQSVQTDEPEAERPVAGISAEI